MIKPNIKYRVTLTGEERETLLKPIRKGKTAGYRIRHARLLPALDEIPANETRTDEKTGKAYRVHIRTIGNMRKRFAEEGFEAAVERKKRGKPPRIKTDGEAEAKITALTCGEPPEGRRRRTLKLSANKASGTGIPESVSDRGIGGLLKKTKLSHGYTNSGA